MEMPLPKLQPDAHKGIPSHGPGLQGPNPVRYAQTRPLHVDSRRQWQVASFFFKWVSLAVEVLAIVCPPRSRPLMQLTQGRQPILVISVRHLALNLHVYSPSA